MEKQPNSRMCFVCSIDTPIETDGAPSVQSSSSTPTTWATASPVSIPSRSIRGFPGNYTAVSSARCWSDCTRLLGGVQGQRDASGMVGCF